MEYSKGQISIDRQKVKITYRSRKEEKPIHFKKGEFKEYAYFKKKNEVEINKWLVGGVLFAFLVFWISLSEYHGGKEPFKTYDNVVMPISIILFFMTLFFDVLGDLYVTRYLIRVMFFWRKRFMVIILNSGKEYQIPVRNSAEADRIASIIKSP